MLEEEFDKYVSTYDLNNENIRLKYEHSYRVMELNVKYAKKLNYSKEDIEIAKIVGLLHDFGRFEQLRVYNTYNDAKSIDHADYSVDKLFKEGLIKNYTDKEEWYPIIEYAIKNHNKKDIEPTTNTRALMHAKLIRDTDKIDILNLMANIKKDKIISDDSEISPKVLKSLKNHEQVSKLDRRTKNDEIAIRFAFAYDINNDIVIKDIIKYLNKYYKIVNNEKFTDIYQEVIKYLNERIDNYDRNGN